MTFVDPGAIGECDARTQGGSIVETIEPTEDAAARRRVRPGGTIAHCVRASKACALTRERVRAGDHLEDLLGDLGLPGAVHRQREAVDQLARRLRGVAHRSHARSLL
jgi:hypothetical protein